MINLTPLQVEECDGCSSLSSRYQCTALPDDYRNRTYECPCKTCILKMICIDNCEKFDKF